MWVILPLFFFALLVAFISSYSIQFKKPVSWRRSFLGASVVWGLVLLAITEGLSVGGLLTKGWVSAFWMAASISLIVPLTKYARKIEIWFGSRINFLPVSTSEKSLLTLVFFVVGIVGVIAITSPPNNWDSMTYHMARVVHWIQNQSVSFYPTHIVRQLYSNPWAEYAILNLQILSGGDRYANLVQWFGMVGSAVGVSLIAKQLGANGTGQLYASVVVITIPMGILQGSSTQNDFVVAFFLVCFVSFGLTALRMSAGFVQYSFAGASLGLAILTKGTAYIYALPFLVWFFCAKAFQGWQKLLRAILVIGLLGLFLNSGHYARNMGFFGFPLGPRIHDGKKGELTNEIWSFSALVSNTTRGAALHLGTPIGRINETVKAGVGFIHDVIGADIHDPRTTFLSTKFHIHRRQNHEDFAGNLLHFLLFLSVGISFLVPRLFRKEESPLILYSGTVVATFLLFSALIKWQAFGSRLHLPFFVLFSPVIGCALGRFLNQNIAKSIAVMLVVAAVPWVMFNGSRPMTGGRNIFQTHRMSLYFNNRPDLEKPYQEAVQDILSRGCANLGLLSKGDDWEYPFWILLRSLGSRSFRLEHVEVKNVSKFKANSPEFKEFTPCAMLLIHSSPKEKEIGEMRVRSRLFVSRFSSPPVTVFYEP